jgi:hypothetical protein
MSISLLGGFFEGYNADKKREAEMEMVRQKMKLQADLTSTKRKQDLDDQYNLFVQKEQFKKDNKIGNDYKTNDFAVQLTSGKTVTFPTAETFNGTSYNKTGKRGLAIESLAAQFENATDADFVKFQTVAEANGYGSNFLEAVKPYFLDGSKGNFDVQTQTHRPAVRKVTNVSDSNPFSSLYSDYAISRLGINPAELKQGEQVFYTWNTGTEEKPAYTVSRKAPNDSTIKYEKLNYHNVHDLLDPSLGINSVITPGGKHVREDVNLSSIKDLRLRNIGNLDVGIKENQGTIVDNMLSYYTGTEQIQTGGDTLIVPTGFLRNDFSKDIYKASLTPEYNVQGDPILLKDDDLNRNNEEYRKSMFRLRQLEEQEDGMFSIFKIMLENEGGIDALGAAGTINKNIENLLGPEGQLRQIVQVGKNAFRRGRDSFIEDGLTEENAKIIEDAFNTASLGKLANGKEASARERLDALFTILAYNVALQIQGGDSLSARISNEDFNNAYRTVAGGATTPERVRVQILLDYLDKGIVKRTTLGLLENASGYRFGAAYSKAAPLVRTMIDRPLDGQTAEKLGLSSKNPLRIVSAFHMLGNDSRAKEAAAIINMAFGEELYGKESLRKVVEEQEFNPYG